jgi:iron complex outermembrane receptor protein
VGLGGGAFAWSGPVAAADAAASATVEEVVVTAEKRLASEQQTALTMTVVSGDDLARRGDRSIEQLDGVLPSLAVNDESGTTKVNIRGVGLNVFGPAIEGNVAVYANEVYLAHPQEVGAAFLDVKRLEVLRGPQGALYGRNATGGAINVIPNGPGPLFAAGVEVQAGAYADFGLNGYVGGPLVGEAWKFRFAAQYERHDGYTQNATNGAHYGDLDAGGLRAMLEYSPPDGRLRAVTTIDLYRQYDRSVVSNTLGYDRSREYALQLAPRAEDPKAATAAALGIPLMRDVVAAPPGPLGAADPTTGKLLDPATIHNNYAPYNRRRFWGLAETIEYKLADDLTLRSITGWRQGRYDLAYDGDGTGEDVGIYVYGQAERWRTFTQELQLLREGERLQWIAGAYFMNDSEPLIELKAPYVGIGLFHPYGSGSTLAYAVFAQATYALTPELKLTIGGRFNYEVRHRNEFYDLFGQVFGPQDGPGVTADPNLTPTRISFSKFVPKVTLQYEPSPRLNAYFTVAEGFKSGEFAITAAQKPVPPEELWDYELGAKLRLLDERLELRMAAYRYDYKNIQSPVFNGVVAIVESAPGALIQGGEVEAVAQPIAGLTLSASADIIDGHYTEFAAEDPVFPELGVIDLKGKALPFNSRYAFSLGADYTTKLGDQSRVEFGLRYAWRSDRYFDAFGLKNLFQPAEGVLDARARYVAPSGGWYVEAYGKNLTDALVVGQAFDTSLVDGNLAVGVREPPRTYGLRIGATF